MQMRAGFKLLTVLAVASLTAVGCGDDEKTNPGTDTVGGDTTVGDDTTDPGDTTTGNDTTSNPCGTRECGVFAGATCGPLNGACPGTLQCNTTIGKCEEPGQPMGAFCGQTATCNSTLPQGDGPNQFPGCQTARCESDICLGNVQGVFVLRDVCSAVCRVYKDTDNNGVNDDDAAQDDCNPADIVDGPAGNVFRCVSIDPTDDVGVCVPGTTFATCETTADCPTNETCEITNLVTGGLNIGQRCIGAYRENSEWTGEVVGVSEACAENPNDNDGKVALCESTFCTGAGCTALCESDADCDTTVARPETRCTNGKCGGTDKDCTADVECSSWTCSPPEALFETSGISTTFRLCTAKNCDTDAQCGAGFYCRFFWNGEIGDASGPANACLSKYTGDDAADLGEACDPNPNDNIPGATCASEDLCIGGFCSAMCLSDADCNTSAGQVCTVIEVPIDQEEDGIDDALLPLNVCQTFEGSTGDCLDNSDCQTGEQCNLFAKRNPDQANAGDAPYVFGGKCQPIDTVTFPGTTGDYGATCNGSEECKSGFCLGASDTQPGVCSVLCSASSDCPAITVGGETAQGLCNSFLYGWGADLEDPRTNYNINLCVPTADPMTDCSDDFACGTDEACFPNVISFDPTIPSTVEFICADISNEQGQPAASKNLGDSCNPSSDNNECLSGICFSVDGSATQGYCSALCDDDTNAACGNGTSCIEVTRAARRGVYAANAVTYGLCLKDPTCDPCYGHDTCPGDHVCVRVAAPNAAAEDDGFRCVPNCADTACSGGTSCNTGTDQLGDEAQGCFNLNGANPAVSCTTPQ
jgi:hypothetical protein